MNTRTLVNNGELQGYADRLFPGTAESSLNLDRFRISDGNLEIVAEPLKEDIRQFTWGRSYSSGLLTSKGSFSQKYGVFEIGAKMPRRKGLWPAFWLLPANNTWPPELDILEILGDNPQNLYVSWHSNVGGTHSSETKAIDVPDTSTEFHTYFIDWTKDTINWFCDDIQVARKSTPEDFRQPIYGLLNLRWEVAGSARQIPPQNFPLSILSIGSESMREEARGSWFGELSYGYRYIKIEPIDLRRCPDRGLESREYDRESGSISFVRRPR